MLTITTTWTLSCLNIFISLIHEDHFNWNSKKNTTYISSEMNIIQDDKYQTRTPTKRRLLSNLSKIILLKFFGFQFLLHPQKKCCLPRILQNIEVKTQCWSNKSKAVYGMQEFQNKEFKSTMTTIHNSVKHSTQNNENCFSSTFFSQIIEFDSILVSDSNFSI